MSLKLYGIPNCDTVKKARVFLENNKFSYEFIDFKKSPPDEKNILLWKKIFGDLPVNKSGLTYKKHKDEYEQLKEKDKISFIIKNSSMIKRPILMRDQEVLCFGFQEKDYLNKL